MRIILKYASLNVLEPSGPVQACNGIALPLPLLFTVKGACLFGTHGFLGNWLYSHLHVTGYHDTTNQLLIVIVTVDTSVFVPRVI